MAADAVSVLERLGVVDRLATVLAQRDDPAAKTASALVAQGVAIAGALLSTAHADGLMESGSHPSRDRLETWLAEADQRSTVLATVDPDWTNWSGRQRLMRVSVRPTRTGWELEDARQPGAPAVPTAAGEWMPSAADVEVLLSGLGRLLDDVDGGAEFDEELFDECQRELDRLRSIGGLSGPQALAAVALLYRWNSITQAYRRAPGAAGSGTDGAGGHEWAPGLYPDPTGAYRKRFWDGQAWGAGVGRPRVPKPDQQND